MGKKRKLINCKTSEQHWVPCSTNISAGKQRRHQLPNWSKLGTLSFLIFKSNNQKKKKKKSYQHTNKKEVNLRPEVSHDTDTLHTISLLQMDRMAVISPVVPQVKTRLFLEAECLVNRGDALSRVIFGTFQAKLCSPSTLEA